MGYYTRYTLSLVGAANPDDELRIIHQLREWNEYAEHAFSDAGSQSSEVKWYDHEDDLLDFSRRFPQVTFKLSGRGEENGDIWDKYFRNGKMQTCRAEIRKPDFDPSKLQ